MLTQNCFSQKDTLDAMWTRVITNNEVLINYSNELSKLDKCNPASSEEAFNIYMKITKNININTKDTALLMYMYFYRSYEYFECPESINSAFYISDDNFSTDSVIKLENLNSLNKYGYKLMTISHGDVVTAVVPGFTEGLFKDKVRSEIKDFLQYWTMKEKIIEMHCRDGNCNNYVRTKGEYLRLLEEYINSNNLFFIEKLKRIYYYNLLFFTLGHRSEFHHYYSTYHIKDTALNEIFIEFVDDNPQSKATWFIKTLNKAIQAMEKEKAEELLSFLMSYECIDEECCNYFGEDYQCKDEYFNYDDFEKNVNEIIRCFKDGNNF